MASDTINNTWYENRNKNVEEESRRVVKTYICEYYCENYICENYNM